MRVQTSKETGNIEQAMKTIPSMNDGLVKSRFSDSVHGSTGFRAWWACRTTHQWLTPFALSTPVLSWSKGRRVERTFYDFIMNVLQNKEW